MTGKSAFRNHSLTSMDACFKIGIFSATSNAPYGHEDATPAFFFLAHDDGFVCARL